MVVETLAIVGIDVVLVGGSCVCIYTNERFGSFDLDFIDISYARRKEIAAALTGIGFTSDGGRYFEHDECQWTLEFPTAPLAIGDEQIGNERVAEMKTDAGTIRLLNPTDCVKDRLLWWYLSKDAQCWEQALDVAQNHAIQWGNLETWHVNEGFGSQFKLFRQAVNGQ